jgi:hypothetical protein
VFPGDLQPKPQIESLPDRQTASRDQSSFSWAQSTLEKVRCARLRLRLRLRL